MIRTVVEIIVIVVLAAIPAAALTQWHARYQRAVYGTVPLGSVSLEDARRWERVLWIDARSVPEYLAGHIPNAVNLTHGHWMNQLPKVIDAWEPGTRVVVYCSGTSCTISQSVAEKLREEMGWEDVYVLHGGYEAWQEAAR